MNEQLFDHLMVLFAISMWWVTLYKHIHTGVLGSAGCIGLSICALMATDDSAFVSVDAVEYLMLGFCASVGLVLLHVALCSRHARKDHPDSAPHRRRTDWQAE